MIANALSAVSSRIGRPSLRRPASVGSFTAAPKACALMPRRLRKPRTVRRNAASKETSKKRSEMRSIQGWRSRHDAEHKRAATPRQRARVGRSMGFRVRHARHVSALRAVARKRARRPPGGGPVRSPNAQRRAPGSADPLPFTCRWRGTNLPGRGRTRPNGRRGRGAPVVRIESYRRTAPCSEIAAAGLLCASCRQARRGPGSAFGPKINAGARPSPDTAPRFEDFLIQHRRQRVRIRFRRHNRIRDRLPRCFLRSRYPSPAPASSTCNGCPLSAKAAGHSPPQSPADSRPCRARTPSAAHQRIVAPSSPLQSAPSRVSPRCSPSPIESSNPSHFGLAA